MAKPEFIQEFDVGDIPDRDGYALFIGQLSFQTRDGNKSSRGVPLLPPQPAENVIPTRFFDVDGRGQWNGFKDTYGLVPKCKNLGFGSGYGALTKLAQERTKIQLGWNNLLGAVQTLAKNPPSLDHKAAALIIIIEMISESLRFTEIRIGICKYYAPSIDPTKQSELLGRFEFLENDWDPLSLALQYPGEKLHLSDETAKKLKIETIQQVIRALGMALYKTVPNNVEAAIWKAATQNGRQLVEFFDMRILKINGGCPGKVYGAIIAANGLQIDYIYSRDRKDHESIEPGQHVTLTGPSRTLSAIDHFNLDFNLRNRDAPSADDEVANNRIAWNANNQANKYNEFRTDTINGPFGSAALNYVVMSNAIEALVDILLVDRDGEDPADVYGEIDAQAFSFPDKRIRIFRRESHDHVVVHPNSRVPLLRSALAVPMDASLTISASLWDHGRTSDKEIANGTAEFKPATLQSTSGLITGQHGKLEVRVSWI
ncbi:Ribosome-inactivating protein [Penicillium alfredii]|uniref:Ribosome-inactivating protein n=1 Tax=Penicillium alfredii TaxID=1506179 RepID=A0A9W9G5Z2_9EURO|nr:Ribosome-inactivating protein [Penicillium alfredii]XP_056515141.1 Ribosome-inactivating protein [Penicillium alfredii]XP_056515431.1 Ribosome-inactivating protein [Penicillium alfredii]KAJ5110363.1 Ribosome-inactivating protein [Penicillium alfredii]KAJ5111662.1 Ribosome-inactivating protein [Penicillium alfredii]KAJ5111952.1 Ribosome-inactivating protein [Penicillium alfredii]